MKKQNELSLRSLEMEYDWVRKRQSNSIPIKVKLCMTYDYYGCHCKVVEMRKRFGLQIMQSLYKMMLYHLLLHQGIIASQSEIYSCWLHWSQFSRWLMTRKFRFKAYTITLYYYCPFNISLL